LEKGSSCAGRQTVWESKARVKSALLIAKDLRTKIIQIRKRSNRENTESVCCVFRRIS